VLQSIGLNTKPVLIAFHYDIILIFLTCSVYETISYIYQTRAYS